MRIPESMTTVTAPRAQGLSCRSSRGNGQSIMPMPATRRLRMSMAANNSVIPIRCTDCTADIPYLLSRTKTIAAELELQLTRVSNISELVRHCPAADDHADPDDQR